MFVMARSPILIDRPGTHLLLLRQKRQNTSGGRLGMRVQVCGPRAGRTDCLIEDRTV